MVYVFENQKYQIWFIWEGVVTENVGLFHGHLAHFTAIWYILLPFGTSVLIWYVFFHFGMLHQEKSGNPGTHPVRIINSIINVAFHSIWPVKKRQKVKRGQSI
jgi:hypothetical protein